MNREQERKIPHYLEDRRRRNDVQTLEAPWWAEVKQELQKRHDAFAAEPDDKARAYQIDDLIRDIKDEGWDQPPK